MPPYTKTAGTLQRAIAITAPGMFLSQPPIATRPSIHWPFTQVSIASAITSRDTSEYFIPSVPIPMPSETVGTPKICELASRRAISSSAASASRCSPELHGVIVECALATPIIGRSKSCSR